MAKTFNQIIKAYKKTTYTMMENSVYLATSMVKTYSFVPILKPGTTANSLASSPEYTIQIGKRIKAKDVPNSNTGSTSDALAALDTFSKIDWKSISVGTGNLRSVGLKMGLNENFDIDSVSDTKAQEIAAAWEVEGIERNEKLIGEIFDNATNKVIIPAAAKDTTPIFDSVSNIANKISLLVDDIKGMRSKNNLIIWMNPIIEEQVIKEIGTVFNQEAPIYKTGLKTKTSINNIPVVFDGNLNKFQDTDNTKRLAFIVMDVEALAVKVDNIDKTFDIDLGITRYVGKFFYTIEKLIDQNRVYIATIDASKIHPIVSNKVSA